MSFVVRSKSGVTPKEKHMDAFCCLVMFVMNSEDKLLNADGTNKLQLLMMFC